MRAIFFDRVRHAEALSMLAAASLASGDARTGFMLADRRCRLGVPRAADRLLRARALRLLAAAEAAESELAAAAGLDPADPAVGCEMLDWGPPETQAKAAQRLIGGERASAAQWVRAVQAALGSAPLAAATTFVDRRRAIGWVVVNGADPPSVVVVHDGGVSQAALRREESHFLSACGAVYEFEEAGATDILEVQFRIGGVVRHRVVNYGRTPVRPVRERRDAPSPADHVLAIVPVYAGFEATRACLESLKSQQASIEIRILAVDDCCPDPRLAAHLDREAAAGRLQLIRNPVNSGFAGAVNKALESFAGGDVLLLNSDVVLPPGAVERLRAAVHSSPSIGTATPFTNNGEFISYPTPFRANPMPATQDIHASDQIFRLQNNDETVALPNGVGFCLYVKRDCFEAVGPLPTIYGRGYGEDVEFCLRARAAGFANICAADVFVGHKGGESFGDDKRELVVRNLEALEARHPDYRAECAAFLHADPLKPSRARAEWASPPQRLSRLLVDPGNVRSVREARLRAIAETGRVFVLARSRAGSVWDLRAADAGPPQSLSFDLGAPAGRDALARYFSRVTLDRIEWIGMEGLDEDPAGLLAALPAPIDIVYIDSWPLRFPPVRAGACASPAEARPCPTCRRDARFTEDLGVLIPRTHERISALFTERSQILYSDAMAAAYAERAFPRRAKTAATPLADAAGPASGPRRAVATLGVLMPERRPAAEGLVKALSRRLAGAEVKLVVFGEAFDDLALMAAGNAFVTGKAGPEDYERLIGLYGVDGLLSPYRSSHFWLFAEVGAWGGLPKAYFDWSLGLVPRREGDLALDPRSCDAQATHTLRQWLRAGAGP
jgi:GT2 family glycosyltransferase